MARQRRNRLGQFSRTGTHRRKRGESHAKRVAAAKKGWRHRR